MSVKREIRTYIRKVREAVQAGDVDLAENHFRLVAKKLDRAGGRNMIHQNAVARIKSRLSARIKAIKETV
jgi:small subunit ribosomal protein S20